MAVNKYEETMAKYNSYKNTKKEMFLRCSNSKKKRKRFLNHFSRGASCVCTQYIYYIIVFFTKMVAGEVQRKRGIGRVISNYLRVLKFTKHLKRRAAKRRARNMETTERIAPLEKTEAKDSKVVSTHNVDCNLP